MILLEEGESGRRLPRSDRRWEHLKKVLKKRAGDRVEAGLVDGSVGSALLRELDDSGFVLDFEARSEAPALHPLTLILGFPRPIQASRILRDLASLGLARIELTGTELGEKSYRQSELFAKGDFRRQLIEGAEQAANPRLPAVRMHWSLARCLETLGEEGSAEADSVGTLGTDGSRGAGGDAEGDAEGDGSRIMLHPYGESRRLGLPEPLRPPVVLAVGSERGWTEAELTLLEAAGFQAASLGGRILRTETAALAACALALGRLGLM